MKKKKKQNIKLLKSKMYIVICCLSVILIVLLVLFGFKLFDNRQYYKVEPRVSNIKTKGKLNDVYETGGWLRIQGTKIDIPILYSEDFSEAFPMDLEDFAWTENSDTKFHNMIRIVGHNLYNLSASPKLESEYFHRFEQLMNFVYYDFAKENKYIQYTIDGKDYVYKIFSAGFIKADARYQFSLFDDYDKDTMKNQIKLFKDASLYNYNVDVNENDKLISLSTCTRFLGIDEKYEFYVVGRLVRDGEKINNYKVTKRDNYKKVEKILKGDDDNEKVTL